MYFPRSWPTARIPNEVLKENKRSTVLPDMRFRNGLVATELALSLVLLVVAGLMIKSLIRVVQADTGYQSDGVVTAKVVLPATQYKTDAERRTFVRRLTEGLAALPGVDAAGLKDPLLGPREDSFVVEDHPRPAPGSEPYTEISLVTPGAFEAMGMKLDSGRYFQSSDDENASPVCIVAGNCITVALSGHVSLIVNHDGSNPFQVDQREGASGKATLRTTRRVIASSMVLGGRLHEIVIVGAPAREQTQSRLAATSPDSQDQTQVFVEARLWYDAIESCTTRLKIDPNDGQARQLLAELYDQLSRDLRDNSTSG